MLCSNYSSYGIILLGKFIILRAFLLQMYGKSKKFLKLQLNIGIAEKSLKLCQLFWRNEITPPTPPPSPPPPKKKKKWVREFEGKNKRKQENSKGKKEKLEKDTEIFIGDFSFSHFQTDGNWWCYSDHLYSEWPRDVSVYFCQFVSQSHN